MLMDCGPLQVITTKWGEVKKLVPARDSTLQGELGKQQSILLVQTLEFSKGFIYHCVYVRAYVGIDGGRLCLQYSGG